MRRHPTYFGRKRESGIIITLVAIFLLFIVGAMAALSIDVTTFYTARSEAQIAADSAALAGARVLASSGMTSATGAYGSILPFPVAQAEALATSVATQVAQQNLIEGSTPTVTVTYSGDNPGSTGNPHVTVQVSRNDLPTFFARIWGTTQIKVSATATAEAYNPSGLATGSSASTAAPVAPTCVKPWLLPNLTGGNPIFDPDTGEIKASILGASETGLAVDCTGGNCSGSGLQGPEAWMYYPGDTSSTGMFAPPSSSSVVCSPAASGYTATPYQLSVAGCVQTPITCNATNVNIDLSNYPTRDAETFAAINCVAHSSGGAGDAIDQSTFTTYGPFEFLAGGDNPLVQAGTLAALTDVTVSDSLVTVPVFDITGFGISTTSVNLVGFVQLFLNPDGSAAPAGGPVSFRVVNLIGCGAAAAGTPVFGNGPSGVAVRLITSP